MKRLGKVCVTMVAALTLCASAFAADWYVSPDGSNKAEGTKAAPFKNIQKAVNSAAEGDTIYVAAGNYYGLTKIGYISITKGVTIKGGYSADFGKRDILKNQTLIQPPNTSNGTSRTFKLIDLKITDPKSVLVLDGLIIDRGLSNSYHDVKGKPKGVETGMWLEPPAKGSKDDGPSIKTPLIGGDTNGSVTISNCVLANGWYGIQLGHKTGKVLVDNNVFVANLMAACEVRGMMAKTESELEFSHNTVLFNWSRTKAMEDMGYGVRVMTGTDYNIHDNIIGLSSLSGVDWTHVPSDKKVITKVTLKNNVFFLNRQADLLRPGSGKFLRLHVEDFEDLDEQGLDESGDTALTDPKAFKGVIDAAYLDGFMNATYTETTDYDPNSSANQFRSAMGLNKQGKIESDVSMFGNRYSVANAIKLFGANKKAGAQLPK